MLLDWKQSTADCWTADFSNGIGLVVRRNRFRRRMIHQPRPWRPEIFGQVFGWEDFEDCSSAMAYAEKKAAEAVASMSKWARKRIGRAEYERVAKEQP